MIGKRGYSDGPAWKEVNGMGMTDLQFKSYVRKLISMISDVSDENTKEEIYAALEKLRKELQEDLQG